MRVVRRFLLVLSLGAAAFLAALLLIPASHHWPSKAAARLLGVGRLVERRWGRDEGRFFSVLATSQAGYGPAMRKQFTSPLPFQAFLVRDESNGTVAFQGGGPLRTVATDLLGDIHAVWIGDFSPLAKTGRYRVVAYNGLSSYPFSVGTAVFDGPLRAVQRWFYYQRAFSPVAAPFAEGPWTHPSDADKAPPGVHGGWHDAGDFSVYSASMNEAIFWLLTTYSDFSPGDDDTNIPESGNGIPDLLDEARWGLAWLLSVQDGASGGFRSSTCQESYGPYGTNTPNSVPVYKSGEVGTLATARAVGNLAYASTIYQAFDLPFSNACLTAARRGMRYLEEHRGENSDGLTCPALRRDGDAEVGRQARMFAAAGMLLATGEPGFARMFEENFAPPSYDPGFLQLSGQASLLYLRAPKGEADRKQSLHEQLRANADRALAEANAHPFGWATRYHWGSLGAGLLRSGLSSARLCLDDPDGATADCEQALASVHYLLGRNGMQFCYISGLSGVTRGMSNGFHQWLAALRAQPRDFPGMVAGGPCEKPEPTDRSVPFAVPLPVWGYFGDPAFPRNSRTPVEGRYTDNDSWSTNEPSVVWEAESLYHLHLARWLAAR